MVISKTIVIISLIVLIISNVNSQKCTSPSIDEENFNDNLFVNELEIEPKHKGLIVEFVMENTLTIDATGSSTKYMTVEFEDQKLRISTTAEFVNYELNEIDTLMTIEINFVCVEGTRRLNFYQNIKVVNNYAPAFSKTNYEIKIPTPLPKGLDVTMFMMDEAISAIDYDLKFYQLEFTVSDTTLFSVESRKDSTSKRYTGIIKTNQQITKLTSPVIFTITAMDSFEGNRKSSSVTVKVFSDPEVLNIDPPSFQKPLYRGMVMQDGSFEMETITPTYVEDVEFVLEGDYAKYFSIQRNSNEIKLLIKNPLDVEILKLNFVTFSVVARKEASSDGIATILIEIDSKEQKDPSFEKVFYEGVLVEKDETFSMEEIVLNVGTYTQDVEFIYSGKDLDYFQISRSGNIIQVQLSESFDFGNVKDVNELMFEIEATKPGHTVARTVVLVRISKFVIVKPKFEKTIYIGHKPDIGVLDLENIAIVEETFDKSIVISLQGEDANLFEIKEQNENVIQVGLKNAVLETEKEFLQLVVEATIVGLEVKELANIFISVGQKNPATKALSFSKSIYEGSVTKEMKLIVEKVMLNEDNLDDDVVIQLSGRNQQFFTFTKTSSEVLLSLKEGVTFDQLPNIPTLLVSVDAISDKFRSASTNVVVTIVQESDDIKALSFRKSIYEGSVTKEMKLIVEKVMLNEDNLDDDVVIQLSGRNQQFFTFTKTSSEVLLTLKEGVTFDQLPNIPTLLVSVDAISDKFRSASTNVVVTIVQESDDIKALSFRKSIYEGSVTKEMKLIVEKVMLNEDNLDDDVVIQLSGRNQQFFTFTKTSSEVLLTLKEGVTFDQLPNIPTLLVSVDAISDKFRSASTNVVVTIVQESDDIKVLSFSKSIYEGSVTKEMKLIVEKVKLNEDNLDDDVVIQLSGRNQQFFTFTKTSSEVLLTLKEGVTFDQLPNIPTLLVSVDAISDKFRSASTNVVVTIVQESDDIKALSFSKSIYEGSVTKEMKLIVEKVKLNEDNLDDDVVIQLSGRNQQFFTFTKTSSEVLLTLKEGVTFDLLPNIPTLLVSVDAISDKFRSASTNVVVTIVQESDDIKALSFRKSIYEGSVTKEMKLIVEKVMLNEDNLDDDVMIQLSGRNQQFFTFTKTSSEVLLTLKKGVTFDQLPNIPTLLVSVDAISDKFRSASTNVVVTIVQESDDIKALSFRKSIYEGSVTKEMKLMVEKVMLNEDNLDDDVVIQLSGRNQQFFTFTKTSSEVLLTLKDGVTFDQLPNIPTLLVSVDAISDKFRSASTNVVVTIVQEYDDIKALSFSKSIYEGSVTKEMKLIVEKVMLNEDNLDDDVMIQLSGRNQQFFKFTKTSSEVLLTLKEGVTFDQLPNIPTLLVSVDAMSDKFRSASTNVVISIAIEMNSDLKFQKSLYIGSVNNLKQLLLENLLIESNNNIDFHIEITGDDKDLFSIDVIDNSVTVSLQKDITEDLWNSRVIFIINITATFNGMKFETIVVITLPKKSEDKLLLFEKPSYIGSIDLNTVLDLEQIVLELNNYDSMVTFEFSGMNSDLFAMQVDRNSVSLQLKEGITIKDFANIVLITLEIKAKRVNFITGMTIVFLQLPWKVEQVDFLSFDKVSYRGKFNIDKELLLDTIKLEPTTFSNEVIVSLKGDDAGVFSLEQKRNEIELIMRQFTDLENRSIFNLYVEAVKFGAPKAYANVVIDVEKMKKLSFDSLIYVGKLNADYTLDFKVTTVSGEMSANDVSFVLKSDVDIDLFEVKRQGNDLVIVNSTQITDDHLVNKLFFSFYLEASKDKFYSAMSLIIIEIPMANSSVPIEDCIDKSDSSQPFFETGAYSFVFQSDMKGSFGRVKAMIVDPKMGRIQYKLQTQDDYLSLSISVNAESGHLIISKELAVGLYTVTAVAINTENNKMAYTRISITVESARICTEDALTTVQKTLAIEVLPENIDYNTILPTVIGNCELDIFSVNPSALRELFIIDRTTHFLTSLKFDREDPLFVNQTVPQIQLKLNLNCASKSVVFQNYTEIQEQHLILTDDILFSTDLMVLNIVIEDQNDNFPVFTYPATKSFTVGYPEQKLADKLLPPNLMIVEAFDVDEGLNAKIKYTLNVNRHFAIDPEAGIIYPLTECMLNVSEIDLVVTATDRFGALDGNAESFNLKVRKVTKDNLVVLTTENEQLSDVELFLRNISGITRMNLLSIHYAAIPHDDNEQKGKQLFSFMSRLKMNEVLTFIKVFVYAFDVEGELKTSDGIIELLKISNIPVALNVEAFVDDVPDYNITGFIIAVSLLGGLLITVCAAIPLLWFLWLSPKLVDSRRKASESSVQQFEEDFNNSPANTSPVLPIKTNTVSDKDILGIQVDGAKIGESPNVLSRLEVELGLILDGREVPSPNDSINSEKKKSNVRFNELVERIEVLADVDDVKVEEEELNERL